MVKAKTTKDGSITKVKFDGPSDIIALELTHIITHGAKVVSEAINDSNIETALFAMIMTAIDKLNDDGHDIDRRRLAVAMLAYKDEDDTK